MARMDVIILGRLMGTASACGRKNSSELIYYDFATVDGSEVHEDVNLGYDHENGWFTMYDHGRVISKFDVVTAMKNAPPRHDDENVLQDFI